MVLATVIPHSVESEKRSRLGVHPFLYLEGPILILDFALATRRLTDCEYYSAIQARWKANLVGGAWKRVPFEAPAIKRP